MTLPATPPDIKTFEEMIERLNSIGGEPRSSILITHLYIEYLLDCILRKKVAKPKYIIKQKFYSKLKIVESLQILSEEVMHELFLINDVRNQFAHRIDIESQDFQNEFVEKVKEMSYYKSNQANFDRIPSYNAYQMIMFRVYGVLANEIV